jgi:enoyl-CoA hydratase
VTEIVTVTEAAFPDVLTRVENGVGRITLNRPKALHALTQPMCEAMVAALLAWRDDPAVSLVMIDHAGERGFCAGGDIRMLAQSGAGDGARARAFFFVEYQLNALLESYPKTTLCIMDGIVMGGGVGLAMPCRFRVATERTVFAMPETGIGLFPDVGGGWWLSRRPGASGLWLALTGARIKAADCLLLGVATDYTTSDRVEALKAAILARPREIDAVLVAFEADAGEPPIAAHRDAMDRLFGAGDPLAVCRALEADGSDWAKAQLAVLKTKSPQTMAVAYRQLSLGKGLTRFADNMAMEYRIGARVVHKPDFQEGVRAVIIDKDNAPRWSPATLAEVTSAEIDAIFAPLPPEQEWTPLA